MKKQLLIDNRVIINHECVEDYWDITGTITEILPEPDQYNGDLVHYVEFDMPLSQLKGEYFASKELDILAS